MNKFNAESQINIKIDVLIHIPSKRFSLTHNLVKTLRPNILVVLLTPEIKRVFLKQVEFLKKESNDVFKSLKLDIISITSPHKLIPDKEYIYIERHLLKYIKSVNKPIIDITGGNKLYSILLYNLSKKYKLKALYLYSYEFLSSKGLMAVPGQEKIFILNNSLNKTDEIIIDRSFDIYVTIKNNDIYVRFSINKKTYQKIISLSNKYFDIAKLDDSRYKLILFVEIINNIEHKIYIPVVFFIRKNNYSTN